jgi:proline iminopeptidase
LGFVCLAGGRIHNDREWHRIYQQKRDASLELPLAFDYPPNLDVNKQINQSWKAYIQRPTLLRDIAHLALPALFIYGTNDIRPSWPVEQVAHLLPRGRLQLLHADHYLWRDEPEQLGEHLRRFVRAVGAT